MSIITSPGNRAAKAIVVSIFLSVLTAAAPVCLAQTTSKPSTKIKVLGQEDRVERFTARHDIGSRFTQKEEGLEISVVRAQRLYNNRRWPNAVVVRLGNVEFANK